MTEINSNRRIARAVLRRGGFLAAAAIVLVAGLGAGQDSAKAAPATERAASFVRTIGDQAMALFAAGDISPGKREAELRRLLQAGVDLPAISRAALGRHWGAATGAQRTEFRELFAEYVLINYSRLLAKLGMQAFTVLGAEPIQAKKPHILVRTEARLADGRVQKWTWRVHETAHGYKIIDLASAGVSLLATRRHEFDSVVAARGLDGLLAALRKRL